MCIHMCTLPLAAAALCNVTQLIECDIHMNAYSSSYRRKLYQYATGN